MILTLIVISCLPVFAGRGGPDGFGYIWIDNREPDGPEYNWIDIKETGERLDISDLGGEEHTVPLSSSFKYYSVSYNRITISTEGAMTMGYASYITPYPYGMPATSTPNAVLAPFWVNLDPSSGPEGSGIYFQDFGDKVVVQWEKVPESYYTDNEQTFQVVLDYCARSFKFNYKDVSNLNSRTAYIGIEDERGIDGLLAGTFSSSGSFLQNGLCIEFKNENLIAPNFGHDMVSDDYFSSDGRGWARGYPTSGPSSAHSETHLWATNLSGDYENGINWVLEGPEISLCSALHPVIDFWHWYDIEEGIDGGYVEISSDDGVSWNLVEPEGGYPMEMSSSSPLYGFSAVSGISDGWEYISFDLSEYAGTLCKLRWRFISDIENTSDGWYIDDFGLHQKYGYIRGLCNLSYTSANSGVEVFLKESGRIAMTDRDGNFHFDSVTIRDDYTLVFSKPSYIEDSLTGITVTRFDTAEVEIMLGPSLYQEDFEAGNGGFVSSNENGWQWGEPSPFEIPYSSHTPTKCWGTVLDGEYENEIFWHLDLSITLNILSRPSLRFWHCYDIPGQYESFLFDGANVKISIDGGETFEVLYPDSNYGYYYDGMIGTHNDYMGGEMGFGGDLPEMRDWHNVTFDMTEYAEQTVIIRFDISSDGVQTGMGWYIDDVIISDNWLGVEENIEEFLPRSLGLSSYPNPFNAETRIEYSIPPGENGLFYLEIYNIKGKRVYHEQLNIHAGDGSLNWNASDMSHGIYLARITNGYISESIKMVLIK